MSLLRRPIAFFNARRRLASLLERSGGRVHVGCNDVRLDGYINIDVRPTSAVDLVHDCGDLSLLPTRSLQFVYSNAFFEHLYTNQRLPFLQDVHRALRDDGWMAFTGLPDFAGVARAYVEQRAPGNVSPLFGAHEAYRYTHGDPEGRSSWWLAQLHKGLLDAPTMMKLLRDAGFESVELFGYCWGNEPVQVTFGFLAAKSARSGKSTATPEIKQLLQSLPANINWDSVQIQASFP